ncbi:MAG: Ku protein [Microbacteriaceae bacterium]
MRSIWKGAIAFGLVNVPVKVYSATESHDLGLHQVHDKDGGRIRYQRRCEICGKVIDYEHIDKAYDDGETTVVLTEEDLRSLPAERSREIEVVEFVPDDQIDVIMFDRSYYLEPDSSSPKAYVLLRETLQRTKLTAIVQFALRQKTRLGALRVHGDVLVLQALLWDDEVREADFPALREKVRLSEKELAMSGSLVDSLATDFTPEEFTDEYQVQLRKLIEAKRAKGDTLDTDETFGEQGEEAGGGEVLDLMDALRRSVERSGKGKANPAKPKLAAAKSKSETATKKSPAQKSPAQKSPAQKSPAQKSPAQKSPAKKSPAQKSPAQKSPAQKSPAKRAQSGKSTATAAKGNESKTA